MTKSVDKVDVFLAGHSVLQRHGDNSIRVNGKIVLRPNVFSYTRSDANYAYYTSSFTFPYGYYNTKGQGYSNALVGPYDGVKYLSQFPITTVFNDLKLQLMDELHEHDINLAVAYAEKTKTADHLKSTASKLLKGAKALKKGNFVEAARHLGLPRGGLRKDHTGKWRKTHFTRDEFANKWLEFSYAWTPLYNDMYGSLVAADKALKAEPDRVIPYVKQASFKHTDKGAVEFSVGNEGLILNREYTATYEQRVKASCNVVIIDPAFVTIDALGLSNPALVAWELVPFSFVVDWFLPIGTWLNAMSPLIGLEVRDGFKTVFATDSVSVGSAGDVLIGYAFVQNPSTGKYAWEATKSAGNVSSSSLSRCFVERSRTDITSVEFPQPQFPDSWQQAASALSLFHSFMSKAGRF